MRKFTLIELLVVVAIIGILASMLLPSLSKAREEGYKAVCVSNHKQLYFGSAMYADDNNGWVPPAILSGTPGVAQPYWKVLPAYLESEQAPNLSDVFFCSKHESLDSAYLNWPKAYPTIGGTFTWTFARGGEIVMGQYNLNGTSNAINPSVTNTNSDTTEWAMFGDSPNHQKIVINKDVSTITPPNLRHNGRWVLIAFDGHTTLKAWKSMNSSIEGNQHRGDWDGDALFLIPE